MFLGAVYDGSGCAAIVGPTARVHAAVELMTVVGEAPECELAGRHDGQLSRRQDASMKGYPRERSAMRQSKNSKVWRGADETIKSLPICRERIGDCVARREMDQVVGEVAVGKMQC